MKIGCYNTFFSVVLHLFSPPRFRMVYSLPKNERPREKLLSRGEKNLSEAELIAILLRTGTRGKTSLDLARELLIEQGGLKKLLNTPLHIIEKTRGMGKTKFLLLKAAMELGRRYLQENIEPGEILNNSERTKKFLASRLREYSQEVFACLFLNTHHRVLAFEKLFFGSLTETGVYPREIIKRAIAHNAAKIILTHNHPSGNPQPSQADHDITEILKQSTAWIDIQIIDHIIIGDPEIFSFVENGCL